MVGEILFHLARDIHDSLKNQLKLPIVGRFFDDFPLKSNTFLHWRCNRKPGFKDNDTSLQFH